MSFAALRSTEIARPRIGFLGVGWIGLNRMKALVAADIVEPAAVADANADVSRAALDLAPRAEAVSSLDELLSLELDGIVIATPSALHAEQSIRALESGAAVFCQKPLGRTAAEVASVVAAARKADLPLGVDLSYRFTDGMQKVRDLVRSGELGRTFAADLTFHNAYGPDKPWFYDAALSGGGCVMDLGVHLVDLALWTLDFPPVLDVSARLFAKGKALAGDPSTVEDYAVATLTLDGGAVIRLTCSWNLHAGQDADISAVFHGTEGGAAFRNVGGSFYEFTAERFRGTAKDVLAAPPDEWGGRAILRWAGDLAAGRGFDEEGARLVEVAKLLDRIYGR